MLSQEDINKKNVDLPKIEDLPLLISKANGAEILSALAEAVNYESKGRK